MCARVLVARRTTEKPLYVYIYICYYYYYYRAKRCARDDTDTVVDTLHAGYMLRIYGMVTATRTVIRRGRDVTGTGYIIIWYV